MENSIIIDEWSESLTEKILDVRFFDVEKIKIILSTQLKLAIVEILNVQVPETKRKLNQAKIIAANSGSGQLKLSADVIKLKEQFQKEYTLQQHLNHEIKKETKYSIFHDLCFEKFGKEAMKSIDVEFKEKLKHNHD